MWLFYAMNNGYIPCGNDGMMKIDIRGMGNIRKLAASWLGKRAGRVYLMRSWTQEMCELPPLQFEVYIAQHGLVVAQN